MQRYHSSSCTSAVNNGAISGIQARDTSRSDSSAVSPNFSLNSRRSSHLTPYKLRCDKEQLNSRLGAPDFHPQSTSCPEEALSREYALSGYRETVEGLEESREISLSQVQAFPKPVIVKSKEAIRKCHRAINESRAQKRKAGQVYGVPLSGTLLTKPGIFPEQRSFGEDFRKKWIEGLSQPHKRLRSLADSVPHGYRKKSLFEVLIRSNVPLARATWFIKVTYLNQVRPTDKTQFSRSDQWTKDITEYLQYLLDEFITRNNNSHSTLRRSSQMVHAGLTHHQKGDSFSSDGQEPSLHNKWWYVVRMINWHHAEGLLVPSIILDWVLNQLQEKESHGILQLLLPVLYGVIETILLSQTYVRSIVRIAVRFIQDPSPHSSDLLDNSRRTYTTSAVIEMLRYIILAVPDTFVALNCFPLPACVINPEVQGVVSSIQKRGETLTRAATPNHNVAKALHLLDQTLSHGDIGLAYKEVFENFWDGSVSRRWVAEVSPCLQRYIGVVSSSLLCSVFFICEWASCEFRDFRTSPPHGVKFTGRKDFSQIFIATRVLKLRMCSMKTSKYISDVFKSPSLLHDVIVCWIDQHEVHNGEGFKRLQVLIRELMQSGIFSPPAYVRQLIVSGIVDGKGSTCDLEKRKRHYKMLKQLPAPYVREALEEAQIAERNVILEAMKVYSNERRLVLDGLLGHGKTTLGGENSSSKKLKKRRGLSQINTDELKPLISVLLQLPVSSVDAGVDDSETTGCEECIRAKRQKLSEEQFLYSNSADEGELWWVRKGMKYVETYKDTPPKPAAKNTSRGSRQKSVRKTQSLAQLAAARIEGSQGASTSHVCESRVACSHHHRTMGPDGVAKSGGSQISSSGDIVTIGKILKQMQFFEKRRVTLWLISLVKQLIEDQSSIWRLGEDELSTILYVVDVCNELVLGIRFLFWLLPKVAGNPGSTLHNRNIEMISRVAENSACEVGEAFVITSIRRYENIIIAADLIPETLSAAMHRATSFLASSNGRFSSSPALTYTRYLLKKHSKVSSVIEWDKTFRSTCDKRLSSELDRSSEGDSVFFGVPNGVEDLDEYYRQKITTVRVSRVGISMKEIAQRIVNESSHYFYGKERKSFGTGIINKIPGRDDGYQIAHQIMMGLLDCMRQTGGAAQEGDPSLVSSAISAIISNVGQSVARIPDLTTVNNYANTPSPSTLVARRILRVHITSLCILKEALGERQSRVFDVALATEASTALLQAFTPGKDANTPNESVHNNKAVLGRGARLQGAVSALVVGAILQGVSSLDRMVTLFKLRDRINLIQFARTLKPNVNGKVLKSDHSIEVSVNWFRVLVGNCRTVCDGFIVHLLGETSILALSRMQRTLSLNSIFSPAYNIFSFVIWRPILDSIIGVREDFHQLYQSMGSAISDAIKHVPFREICLRDTHVLYNLISEDTLGSEFLSVIDSNGSDTSLKGAALVPIRARLFLDSLIDWKLPPPQPFPKTEENHKKQCGENVKNLMGKLVHVLDTLQPARFHWQWVQLRLLLNEQIVNEKMENDVPLTEAIRKSDKNSASENESHFPQIVLTRLLVRPDAAQLFSEVVHRLGKSVEDSMISQAKWLLRGWEVLYGKKSVRQKIRNIAAELKEQSLKPQFYKPWGWCNSDTINNINSPEEGGEVVDVEGLIVSQQHVTERALIELILPCVDRGSDELRGSFASEMIKQMSNIEQAVTRGGSGKAVVVGPTIGSPAGKSGNRKAGKSGSSPGITRQGTGSSDTVPPAPAALRASMTLRLQFLIRLLPIICADREPSARNMRYALASVILRLLGSRIVHEDAGLFANPALILSNKRDLESLIETPSNSVLLSGESLFDCLLLVLHVLMSSYQPSWLKSKSESSKDYAVFDPEVAESLQNELNRMELPDTIRWRIQTAMPILFPSVRCSSSFQPPIIAPAPLPFLQPRNPSNHSTNSNQKNPVRASKNKPQQPLQQELDAEIDQWTILEDGASSQVSANSAGLGASDQANLKASNYLKGAVRLRRTDLTYIGAVDDDS